MNIYLKLVEEAKRHFFDPLYINEKYKTNIEKICYHAKNSEYPPKFYFDLLYTHVLDLILELKKYKGTLDYYMNTGKVKEIYDSLNVLTGFF